MSRLIIFVSLMYFILLSIIIHIRFLKYVKRVSFTPLYIFIQPTCSLPFFLQAQVNYSILKTFWSSSSIPLHQPPLLSYIHLPPFLSRVLRLPKYPLNLLSLSCPRKKQCACNLQHAFQALFSLSLS